MVDIVLRGRLSPWGGQRDRTVDGWVTACGAVVRVQGRSLRVTWLSAPDGVDATLAALRREIEAVLLMEALETGGVVSVVWTEERVTQAASAGGSGGFTTVAHSFYAAASIVRRQRLPLSTHASRATRLSQHTTASAVAQMYLDAIRMLDVDDRAAVAVAYVGAERLVDDLTNRTDATSWATAASLIGLAPTLGSRFYYSAQFKRHYQTSRAEKYLKTNGLWPPLTARDCCASLASMLEAYLQHVGV